MPNPFPGMNPYLENPQRWRDVHNSLIYCFRAALSAVLPPAFAAIMEERVYVQHVGKEKEYVADALVTYVSASDTGKENGEAALVRTPQDKTSLAFDKPRQMIFDDMEEREVFLNVRAGKDFEEVIAVVEFLSPTNKTPGVGRNTYKQKQQDLLNSNTHLLEIDLLRSGLYSLAPPETGLRERLGSFDYLISLHHAGEGAAFDIWAMTLRERLPRLLLPLTNGEAVVVDLQEVLERAYRDGDYDRIVDYLRPPNPPLEPGDASWADAQITAMQTNASEALKGKN